jgi:hypothetical protein
MIVEPPNVHGPAAEQMVDIDKKEVEETSKFRYKNEEKLEATTGNHFGKAGGYGGCQPKDGQKKYAE